MALKSSREGLRKELVDYLGNIIIDENLKQNIIYSVDDVFINNEELATSVNELDEKISNETSARESADTNLSDIKANKSDVLTYEEIQASTDLTGKIASASALNSILRRYHLFIEPQSSANLDISNLERNREYLLLYSTTNGAYVSGAVLVSSAISNPVVKHLSDKTLASFGFIMEYPTITIQNNEGYSFDTYITIIG